MDAVYFIGAFLLLVAQSQGPRDKSDRSRPIRTQPNLIGGRGRRHRTRASGIRSWARAFAYAHFGVKPPSALLQRSSEARSWRKEDIRQNGPWSVARSSVGRSTGNPAFEERNLLLGPCAIAWHRAGT